MHSKEPLKRQVCVCLGRGSGITCDYLFHLLAVLFIPPYISLSLYQGVIVCKIGGPAYRIGMGGGAASSRVTDTADAALDCNAVQRGGTE
jgi:hypothetical protein